MTTEPRMPNINAATSDTSPSGLSQVAIVGAVTMTLAGVSLLVTLVLVLSLWMPSWVATLAMTVLLTATSLAVFASGNPNSRLRGVPVSKAYAAFPSVSPTAPVSVEPPPEHVKEPAFQESGVHTSPLQSLAPVQATEAIQIEADEFEDALPDNDEQETTVVRHFDRLMSPAERTGLGQHHIGLGQRTTRPLFQKTTQPSIARSASRT